MKINIDRVLSIRFSDRNENILKMITNLFKLQIVYILHLNRY